MGKTRFLERPIKSIGGIPNPQVAGSSLAGGTTFYREII